MNQRWACELYTLLLYAYPPTFRAAFAEEMQAVFAEVARENGGLFALLRELRDWPKAVLMAQWQETKAEAEMETLSKASNEHEHMSWTETLAGLWPFLLFGPVSILLAYVGPLSEWRSTTGAQPIIAMAFGLPLLVGLGIGWLRKWPHWAYPYLGVVVLILGGVMGEATARLVFGIGPEWPFWPQFAIYVGSYALLLGGLMLAARAWRPLQPLYQNIRRDWTQLSFGLFLVFGILFGFVEYEEDPVLTLFVFLPPLIVSLGALVGLRSIRKTWRILAIVISSGLAVGVRMAGGKLFYGEYAVVMIVIVFIPALLALLPPQHQTQTQQTDSFTS